MKIKGVTVAELIEFLKTQPQDLRVAYRCCSEHCLLETENVEPAIQCKARDDGWIEDWRDDKQVEEYLVFPGN